MFFVFFCVFFETFSVDLAERRRNEETKNEPTKNKKPKKN